MHRRFSLDPRKFKNYIAVFLVFGLLPINQAFQTSPIVHKNLADSPRRVNIPYSTNSIDWAETAIFWFGINEQGVPSKNYADVRMAYTSEALEIRVTVIDYYLWYNTNPQNNDDLSQYDSVAIFLDTNHDKAYTPQTDDHKFLLGTRHWQDVENYQREARGNGSGWDDSWNGQWNGWGGMSWFESGPNNNNGGIDFGWTAGYAIPWESLGLYGPPLEGTLWGLGVQLFDRDDNPPAGAVDPQFWPETNQASNPSTWGEIHFGEANFLPSTIISTGSTIIRASSPTDNTVVDSWMGGGGLCASGHNGGSEVNHGGDTSLFTGSETAATHFPCFNKSFLRFQLDTIPPGVEIISATLTMHLYGNADQSIAPPFSWTHLFTIRDDWDEMEIHWNNAPLAQENVSVNRVYPYSQPGNLVWPGDPYTWDATQAVVEAFTAGKPANLALYSSDSGRDTSKYFSSSETGDWNKEARPTLKVIWGKASPQIKKRASNNIASRDDILTYQLTWDGNDKNLTLVDQLPTGLGHPSNLQVNIGNTYYDESNHSIYWSGSPGIEEAVILSYQTTVQIDGPQLLINTANLSDITGQLSSDSFYLFIDPLQVFLPFTSP